MLFGVSATRFDVCLSLGGVSVQTLTRAVATCRLHELCVALSFLHVMGSAVDCLGRGVSKTGGCVAELSSRDGQRCGLPWVVV